MVKKIIHFECKICGTWHATREGAEKCEKQTPTNYALRFWEDEQTPYAETQKWTIGNKVLVARGGFNWQPGTITGTKVEKHRVYPVVTTAEGKEVIMEPYVRLITDEQLKRMTKWFLEGAKKDE